MIYTVTLNPSIDYIVRLDELKTGITNRTTSEEYYIGGKGINVSCVLAELGIKSTALVFVAGFTGEAIEKGLKKGIEQGRKEECFKNAKKMKQAGIAFDVIAQVTGLSIGEIASL